MIRNYFKVAWRNLIKDKQFTLLNLIGLSTGLACVLLIYLWVNDELHVDRFNEKDSQLYQVMKAAPNGDGTTAVWATAQGVLADELSKSFPEVEHAVAIRKEGETGILSVGEKHMKAAWRFVSNDFLNVFSYRLIEGSKDKVLADKYGVLISDKLALKVFNTTHNLTGKAFTWDAGGDFNGAYTISGVYEAPPSNATDQFDLAFNYRVYVDKEIGGVGDIYNWGNNSVHTYLILKKGTDVNAFNNKIRDFTRSKIKNIPGSEYWSKWEGSLFVRKYSDGYLHNNFENGKSIGGRIEYVRLFSIIAIFILVIACINFMNLSTAKASGRMKEVGIRKVIGAPRRMLLLQYMGESMLMSFLSLAIAVLITFLLLPVFKEITGKQLSLSFNAGFVLSLLGIAVITGIIAGSYPALYLSGFRPTAVLKGKLHTSASESIIRKGLVVFQFTISVILIIAVIVVYQQMKLIQTKNLGYNKDNIIRFANVGKLQDNIQTFLAEARNIPGVINASSMQGDLLGHSGHSGGGISWEGKDPNLGIEYFGVSGDLGYMEILGLKMATGRTFSDKFGADSSAVIFNEAAIARMGITDPVGKIVSLWGRKKQIIGVVKDFNFESLYKKVGPAFLEYSTRNKTILVKIKAGTEQQTLAKLEQLYQHFNEGLPFEYKFLDEDYQTMYASEQKVSVLSRYFAVITIIISCLGLFGLTAFTAQKRKKEIGIRKVVGASVNSITLMLTKDFLKLVMLAVLAAFPLAWWATNQWLQSFAYRVNVDAAVFLVSGAAIIMLTLVTVSLQAIKAALADPVKSLRSE
ncbi:ABC-type transport system, involved in lipoprotein release, permease component [Chitinophaga rupis]|uniref:ABC-type transport system, involved in lipoprotein release, permease component n=1 Tax=Chitinophaga rupis TaxID=573321 RepID=A0A1H8G8S8_9BACT|nr:ABC transporter permease [Chitinophaga rupis]SEN40144.1 ABC-type transport system, involved in lipoprotein release, permease component [Chitinophaga rupis]